MGDGRGGKGERRCMDVFIGCCFGENERSIWSKKGGTGEWREERVSVEW